MKSTRTAVDSGASSGRNLVGSTYRANLSYKSSARIYDDTSVRKVELNIEPTLPTSVLKIREDHLDEIHVGTQKKRHGRVHTYFAFGFRESLFLM